MTRHKARQRDESEVWNRKITYINRCIYPRPFSHDLLGGKLNCGKQNSLSRSSHISPLIQHFPKCQTDFNFNLLFSLDSSNMHRVRSIGWLCSYALYFPVWFMLQKTYLFLLNFFYRFYLKFLLGYSCFTMLCFCCTTKWISHTYMNIPSLLELLLHPPSHTINFLDIYLHFTHDSLTFLCYKIFCLEQIMLVKFMLEYITPWKINNWAGIMVAIYWKLAKNFPLA